MDKLISVEKALDLVLASAKSFGEEEVSLEKSLGRTLAADCFADRDFPPYHRVTMDGIAILHDSFKQGIHSFPIEALCAAGMPQQKLNNPKRCMEVMTGCVLPEGTDTVIRYEDLSLQDGIAHINIDQVILGKNVHTKGLDQAKGSLVLAKEMQMGPAEIAIAASIGKSFLSVRKMPRTVVISTGDELVDVDKTPLPHQIRKSNVHTIQACLSFCGVSSHRLHLDDEKSSISSTLSQVLDSYDLIILSGGVSKGKFDFIPAVLEELGVIKDFHRVRQRPGKPFWFGQRNKAVIFALPGNPVSSFMCTLKYIKSWLDKSMSRKPVVKYAQLSEDVIFKPNLSYFLPVAISYESSGKCMAKPEKGNGSGDLVGLVAADAFMELPCGRDVYLKGEVFPYWSFRG